MRKLVRMMLVCALSGAVSASCAGMSIAEEAAAEDEKATALESEKAELEERLTQLESENAELQEKLDALLNPETELQTEPSTEVVGTIYNESSIVQIPACPGLRGRSCPSSKPPMYMPVSTVKNVSVENVPT